MNTIIQYLQIASAVYILIIALVIGVAGFRIYLLEQRDVKARINGFPAFVAIVACVVCAVSTLVLLP